MRRRSRAAVSQRIFARIERDLAIEAEVKAKKHGVTIDAAAAAQAIEDNRCPFEMARIANEALRASVA